MIPLVSFLIVILALISFALSSRIIYLFLKAYFQPEKLRITWLKRTLLFLALALSLCTTLTLIPTIRFVISPVDFPTLSGNTQAISAVLSTTPTNAILGVQSISTNVRLPAGFFRSSHGDYSPVDRTIHLSANADIRRTLTHELHHDIWYYKLTATERAAWTDLHERTPAPTDYGGSSANEDFADSGMLYPDLDQERLSFLDTIYCRLGIAGC